MTPPPFSSVDLLPLTTVRYHRPPPTDENLPAVLAFGLIFGVYELRLRSAMWRATTAYMQNATPEAPRAHWHGSALHGSRAHHMPVDPTAPQFPPPPYGGINPPHDLGPTFDSVRIRSYHPFLALLLPMPPTHSPCRTPPPL